MMALAEDPEDVIETPNPKGVGGLPFRRAPRAVGAVDAEDVVEQAGDRTKRLAPHEASRRDRKGPRRPAVWAEVETMHSPVPVYGAFPQRFLPWAIKMLGARWREVLHVCSGALTAEDVRGGTRVDVRAEARPDVVADGRALPFPDASFAAVLLDPPYSVEYARDLYGTEYPRPSHLLREAARVVRPCGRIGFVHFVVPSPPPGCRIVSVRGLTQGCGYRIRALTIYEREQDRLPGEVGR